MKPFRNLIAWQKAHELALVVYKGTKDFPKDEIYGLRAQMRRAAVSIPANIAEACGHGGTKDFARFLRIAFGAASELEYEILLCGELRLLNGPEHQSAERLIDDVKKLIFGLMNYPLKRRYRERFISEVSER